ncbi:tRNA-uridine aminocarboxypropyltransferase [Reinekea blandensis]|uniref:tRNA-uridine aminocarboxypropyltransferase n=1 Tax=Reinekea blandensis MED297 TaxID=314283 RepID=A4BIM1_9GAMM|nr:tRNA-uridine aminocarboxypropyltransferase [Reinekea blandensis]EAR07985.1 hypothetical protein MED297_15485 [Reinekea sp. MED297] [Reinekea blandensis MED297]
MKHAVQTLFEKRLARSTRPFRARGSEVKRCANCRIDTRYCICALKPSTRSNVGFLLLYYDDEVLKPSNTGRLIADLIPDTYAFIWQRTEPDSAMLQLLADPQWQPVVVFPETQVQPGREAWTEQPKLKTGRRPLFILLDGSWREARKMFRKSPYLDAFPVLSVNPEASSVYQVRKAVEAHQLATAEVASCVLDGAGEVYNGQLLRTWFDVFSYRYQMGVTRSNRGDALALERLRVLTMSVEGR